MNTVRQESNIKTARSVLCGALLMLVAAFPQTALSADSPVLSDTPIANTTSVQVKPNIMLLMDTSNSMRFSHMPDEMEGTNNGAFPIGYKSYQCNILYYKPNQIYALPKDSTGAELPLPTFGAAFYSVYSEYVEGSSNPTTLVNLNTSFQAYDTTTRQYATVADPAQPAYYYVYTTATGVEPEFLNFAGAPCTNLDVGATTAASPAGTWTRVLVSSLSAAQQQNFAIWYSYYRTRISMIKSAVSLSFTPLTDSYRVGLVTVKPYAALVPSTADSVAAANYLAIDDFDTTQRLAWFKKLFSQVPGGSSPAREGLARVGRHYANKHDYINTGMDGDPMQYSCQQNFTIMTTDGYWNTAAETRGPVQLDGLTLVGNQDNQLDKTVANPTTGGTINIVPRPIWDGYPDTTRVLTEIVKEYSFDACTSLYGPLTTTQNLQSTEQNLESTTQTLQSTNQNLQSTNQNLQSTNQNRQSTSQNLQSTAQTLQSTNQNLRSTNQNLQSTAQMLQSTAQTLQSTNQNLRSTNQNLQDTTQIVQITTEITISTLQNLQSTNQNRQSTSQNLQSTTQTLQSTNQNRQSTNQNRQSTSQNLQSTTQTLQSTNQNRQSTNQNRQSTNQNLQSTTQTLQSTNQNRQSTNQNLQSTTQTLQSTSQDRQSTSQWFSFDATTELTTPVASCTSGGSITCTHSVTTNVPVASCTPQTAAAGNLFLEITCSTSTTGPAAVASCTAAAESAGNSWTTTTCTPNNTTNVPVATCTAAAASAGNSWTTTTCPAPVVTTDVPVATCTAAAASAGNSWTTTTCPAPVTTGPSGVSSCTAAAASAGNSWTTTTCPAPVVTTNVPVATCTAAAASAGNSWTTTTCPAPVVTTNVAVATCTAAAASAGNSWTTTTCPAPVVTTNVPVATCTAAAASALNSWTTTTCPAPITTGPDGVSSCTAVAASAGNSWTTTTCTPNNTTNVGVATCTASGPNAGNGWTTTTCPAPVVTTNVPVATCTAAAASAGNSWTTTTCPAPVVTTDVPVATCTAAAASAGNSWTTTTCPAPVTTGPSGVSSCTAAAASAGNSWTTTTCPAPVVTTNVPVATCTAAAANAGNFWTTTTCPAPVVTTNVAVATCTAAAASAGNSWTTTTCPAPVVTTDVPVATCTPAVASAGNSWTTTTCPAPNTTGPTVTGSCTPVAASAGNSWTATLCGVNTTTVGVLVCTPSPPTITCGTITTTNIPVATCTPSGPTPANGYTTTTCPPPVVTTNIPVATCTAAAASAGNSWTTTTCPAPVVTTDVPVATCTPAAASAGNSWTTTTCPAPITTGPDGVSSCTAAAASAGNSWTTTTCTANNTTNVGVATCTASGPNAGNGWTTTTCPAPVVTTDIPVATCTAAAASAGNSWTTTTCPAPVTTGPSGVSSCTAAAASALNSWTTTTCTPNNTTNVPVATCTLDAASSGNGWTATTCSTSTTTNVPVGTCTAAVASALNSWTTTTCPAPVVTTNVAVGTCTAAVASALNSWTTTTCPAPVVTTNVPVGTCTAAVASALNSWTTTTCPAPVTTGPSGVSSCTAAAASALNSWTTTTCTPNNTTNAPVATCTAAVASAGNGWKTTTCPAPVVTTDVPVASCSASAANAGNSWTTITCPPPVVATTPEVYNCLPVAASAGNSYIGTTCGAKLSGKELRARIGTTLTTTILSGTTITDGPNTGATSYQPSSGYAATDGICVPDASTLVPALVIPADGPPSTADIPPPAEPADTANINYTQTCASAGNSWPCTLESVTSSGSYNSLADVAQYYYVTDLRTGSLWDSNLAATPPTKNDNVPAAGTGDEDDKAPWQHMTTFTIALGVSGTVNFSPTYKNTPSGSADFQGIRNGTLSWPIWPDPALNYASDGTLYSNPKSIDDFWHTAVDGRGRYFSAGKPSDVVDGLRAVLNELSKKQGSGAAAASSSQTPVQGNNIAFVAKYATTSWAGDIEAREIDLTTGQVLSPVFWRAQPLLDAKTGYFCDNRNIYLFRSGATNNLVDFKWNSGTCTSESIAQGNAPVTIAESTSTTVASAATVMRVTKDTATYPFPAVLTAMAQTGADTPRELNAGDSILAGDVITTTAGVTVAYSVPTYTTVTVAGTVTAVSRDTVTYPPPYVMTVTAKTGAGTPRALNVGDAILANDVVATSAGATIKIEHVVTPLVTTLNGAEQAYFGSPKIALLSQYPDMTDGTSGYPDQRGLADNETLVNFVRGQRGNEGFVAKDAVRLYRKRESVLGDFVDAQPVFVKEPFASYKDAGYAAFKGNTILAGGQSDRKGMIYAAANDGMLHAFYAGAVTVTGTPPTTVTTIDATGGKEAWAFIPTMVLDNLYKLADNDYANRHTFFVDGTPSIGDVYDTTATAWKTILVAGLNKGGKGYYALDVTDPDAPKALWEFKQSAICYDSSNSSTFGADCNLGYSFGKPIITKLANGTWVALVTSGYNNVNGQTGDGEGFLYVLNAMTGQIISKVSTGVGDATTPSGLAQINNFVDNALIDNTTKLVYGGDNEGNVWRFVVNAVADNPLTVPDETVLASATLLGTTKDATGATGVAQPITTRPELGEIAGKPWVFVGTGRLLGLPDLTDVSPQSVYGFDASVTYTDAVLYPHGVRDALRPLLITSPAPGPDGNPVVGATRTVACTGDATECARPNGWVVDLPDAGERVNVDLGLELGTLVFASNVPKNTACSIGGYSWLNFVNFRTGLAVATSPLGVVSNYLGTTLAVGLSIMRLPPTTPGGQGRSVVIVMGSSGVPIDIPLPVDVPPFAAKRVSWREVVQ